MVILVQKKCVPCEAGTPPLPEKDTLALLLEVPGWDLGADKKRITREYKFKDFKEALAFVNDVGRIAEEEGHHPDISLFNYKYVRISLSTHAIGGLSENDFILAAKIDELVRT